MIYYYFCLSIEQYEHLCSVQIPQMKFHLYFIWRCLLASLLLLALSVLPHVVQAIGQEVSVY